MTDEESKKEIIKKFADSGLLITSHGFDKLLKNKTGIDVDNVISVAKDKGVFFISDEFLQEFIETKKELEHKPVHVPEKTGAELEPEPERELELSPERELELSPEPEREPEFSPEFSPEREPELSPEREPEPEVVVRKTRHIFAKEIDSELKIDDSYDVTGKSTCSGTLEDFVGYFNQRYNGLEKIISRRENFRGSVQIKNLKKTSGVGSIIAMVTDKRESKRGFKFLDVEDPTGSATVLIGKDNEELNEAYGRILLDEVIGIRGELRNNLFIAKEIVPPDLPVLNKSNTTKEPVHAAFLSDFHVGSNLFLEKEFQRFLDWINLKSGNRREIAEKIKYIFVAGDLVDGIGIYPDQEADLSIPDIYKQYDFLGKMISQIPEYVEVVLVVGNHDAVRRAEPEPALDKDIGAPLYEIPNVHVLGNPAMVSAHGIKTLIYHGDSMDGVIGHLGGLSYTAPEKAMIEYLKRRHLAPLYNDISPENKDYMIIRDIPDILHGGHVHANGYAKYKGVNIINAGTWQAQTKYQERLGHHPTPARVPVMNLSNQDVTVLHFGDD